MLLSMGVIAGCCSAFLSLSVRAQVYGTTPDGQTGYVSTPNPVAPNCSAPLVWTLSDGHYTCASPPPPPPPPPPVNPESLLDICALAVQGVSGYTDFHLEGSSKIVKLPADAAWYWSAVGPGYATGNCGDSTGDTYYVVCGVDPASSAINFLQASPAAGSGQCH